MNDHLLLMARCFGLVIGALAAIFAAAVVMMTAFAPPARAYDIFADPYHYSGPKKRVRHKHPGPRVKAWRLEEPRHAPPSFRVPPPAICTSAFMISGVQGLTEKGAEEKARDAWEAKVRASLGERFMDLRYARDYQSRCYRSSVGENVLKTMRERLKERVGMIESRADENDAAEYRCDIWAQPCEPSWVQKGATPGAPE